MLITFHKSLKSDILKAFGKSEDNDEYIIDSATKKRVLTKDGEELTMEEFAGLTKGSVVYLKSDIISLINFIEKKHELCG